MTDKVEEKQVETSFLVHQWGPCLAQLKLDDGVVKHLLSVAKSSNKPHNKHLAGLLDKEVTLNKDLIIPNLAPIIGGYHQVYSQYVGKPATPLPRYQLLSAWANFQKQHEFNPPHDHNGELSFVIYLDIPDVLKEENKKFKGRHAGPGSIQFNYGEGNKQFVTYRSLFPEVGDMFIFPASLVHWVIPFKSDCVRISVSGNIDKQTEGLI